MKIDAIIVGAGAAGLMCAIEAGKRGKSVLLVDHAKSVGKKIRISGGGRCNFTNIHTTPNNYISHNSRFCISALKRYSQFDFIKLVEKHGIAYHEKTLGQLFCDGSAKEIISMLSLECESAGVITKLNSSAENIIKTDDGFTADIDGVVHSCKSLVIATGGPSIPKMGATGWGYNVARKFNLKIIEPRPALVPFTFDGKTLEKMQDLSGVALNVIVTCNKKSFKEALLFTHRGVSGPAILQISSYWQDGNIVEVNLAPSCDVFAKLQELRTTHPKQEVQTFLSQILPKRLAQYICQEHNYKLRIADLSNKKMQQIANTINKWQMLPNNTEGFRTAEVTIGGVDVNEISSKTFESKKVNNLYFIGEVLDVTGHLGGFNFQWAWSSGVAAGENI